LGGHGGGHTNKRGGIEGGADNHRLRESHWKRGKEKNAELGVIEHSRGKPASIRGNKSQKQGIHAEVEGRVEKKKKKKKKKQKKKKNYQSPHQKKRGQPQTQGGGGVGPQRTPSRGKEKVNSLK